MKIVKFLSMVGLRRPGGMRKAAGGDFDEVCEILKDLCFGSDTPALVYDKGGGFNRSAHSARPGYEQSASGEKLWAKGY